jgi:peptide chain release factor 3
MTHDFSPTHLTMRVALLISLFGTLPLCGAFSGTPASRIDGSRQGLTAASLGRLLPFSRTPLAFSSLQSVATPDVAITTGTSKEIPSSESLSSNSQTQAAPLLEIARRRNLAIISHPDSGKTTMTEKLLWYGGAIQSAGMVRHKSRGKSTTSDFMAMEQERGISISSTVLQFDYLGQKLNLVDTPGHEDFSEDTYRALAAADNAVMLLDGSKGLEAQTRKLFAVTRMYANMPLFTFVNKMDRPALSPYEIIDQIQTEFNLTTYPVLWPIGDGPRFRGVLDRTTNTVHLFSRRTGDSSAGKQQLMEEKQILFSDTAALQESLHDDMELYEKLVEDVEILEELIDPLDLNRVKSGSQSPLFFGSAMTNYGVELFLQKFCQMSTSPLPRTTTVPVPTSNRAGQEASTSTTGDETDQDEEMKNAHNNIISPEYEEFSGFIFKTQANLDPKHRDRLAYVRIVSGMYAPGMKVSHSRTKTNKKYTLTQAQALFGNDRTTIDAAFPGDVIGINNPGNFAIGDTLYTGTNRVSFPPIPSFSPERFAYIRSPNPSSYKSFRKGIDQLLDEGAIQALRQRKDDGGGPLLLAAVGQLQFEVVQARLQNEYNVESILEQIPSYSIARWADAGWDAVDKADAAGKLFGTMIVQDRWQRPVLLFRNEWKASSVETEEAYLCLKPWSQPPDIL